MGRAVSPGGGTGRHTILRGWRRKVCGFESRPGHSERASKSLRLGGSFSFWALLPGDVPSMCRCGARRGPASCPSSRPGSHRHLDGGVPHQLLDGLQGDPAHYEVAGEGVAQRVPSDGPDARPLRIAEDGLRAGVLGIADEAAVPLREHPRGVEPPWVLAQGSQRPIIERYLSLSATLGSAQLPSVEEDVDLGLSPTAVL
jgi:hypothetical protein